MGGAPTPATTVQYSAQNPALTGQIMAGIPGLTNSTNQFQQQATQAGQQIQGNVPTLNTNFQPFTPQAGLDSVSQGLVSQGLASNNAGTQGRNAQVANQFGGSPGASNILQMQNNTAGALQNNSLPFQAMQQQQAREAQTYQLNNQAQGMTNNALTQQASLKNNSILQGLQMSQAGMGAQQNLMGLLGSLAQQTGSNVSTAIPNGTPWTSGWNSSGVNNGPTNPFAGTYNINGALPTPPVNIPSQV